MIVSKMEEIKKCLIITYSTFNKTANYLDVALIQKVKSKKVFVLIQLAKNPFYNLAILCSTSVVIL